MARRKKSKKSKKRTMASAKKSSKNKKRAIASPKKSSKNKKRAIASPKKSKKSGGGTAKQKPAKVASDQLLTERAPIRQIPDLEDPRTPTWSDEVTAIRVQLLAIRDQRLHIRDDVYSPNTPEGRRKAIAGLRARIEPLTGEIYRYSRNGNLTNDEMGYGERITEPFLALGDGTLKSVDRTSQRTKSGRQTLKRMT